MIFGAAGDWGPDPSATANSACANGVELFLGLGDYSYESGTDDKVWFAKLACLQDKFYGALGNHDDADSAIYSNLFWSTAGRHFTNWNYYSVVELPVSPPRTFIWLIALNTDAPDLDFLEHILAGDSAIAKWKIVFFHKPLYTSPGGHAPDEMGIRDKAVPLFDKYHVDLVLQGHNHNYQRSYPLNYGKGGDEPSIVDSGKGTIYVVAGTGGESHYPSTSQAPYIKRQFSDAFGFLKLSISENMLLGEFIANGQTTSRDIFGIQKV